GVVCCRGLVFLNRGLEVRRHRARLGERGQRGPHHTLERHRGGGRATHERLAVLCLDVPRRGLEQRGGGGRELLARLDGGVQDAAARVHRATAREGADAEGNRGGVPAHDGDP